MITHCLQVALLSVVAGENLHVTRPTIDDSQLNTAFQSARQVDLPKVFLMTNGQFLDSRIEIGPTNVRRTNGGLDFPWRNPGGRGDNHVAIKFVYPPNLTAQPTQYNLRVPNGVRYTNPPQVIYKTVTRDGWIWPEGATFFELHYHEVAGHPFELRVLKKTKPDVGFDSYEVRIFRPEIPDELLSTPSTIRTETVKSSHPLLPFQKTDQVHYYSDPTPRVDWGKIVTNTTWKDDTGHEFHHAGTDDGWLTPKRYFGFITGSKHETCAQCHDTAGQSVKTRDIFRDWYGYFPGGDGVFGFDPVDRASVTRFHARRGTWRWKNN